MDSSHLCHYSFVTHWKEPIQGSYAKLFEAYRVGRECGDNEFGFSAIGLSLQYQFMSGMSLNGLEPSIRAIVPEMKLCQQRPTAELTLTAHEAALVLMGKTEDPVVLDGALMYLEKGSKKLDEIANDKGLSLDLYYCHVACHRIMIEYHLGDLDLALKYGKKTANIEEDMPANVFIRYRAFYYGMAALKAACEPAKNGRKRSRRKLLSIGRNQIKILKNFAKHCSANNQAQVLLLEAELETAHGRFGRAMSKYQESQDYASKLSGFLDVQALAAERHFCALQRSGYDNAEATRLLKSSINLYEEWGAFAKASQMESLLP